MRRSNARKVVNTTGSSDISTILMDLGGKIICDVGQSYAEPSRSNPGYN